MPSGQLMAAARRLRAFRLLDHVGKGRTATSSAVSMALRALLLLGKFAFIVVLARFTNPATLGIYALLVTIVTIAIYIIGLEIHTFTAREIVSEKAGDAGSVHIQSHLFTIFGVYVISIPIMWYFTVWLDISGKFSFLILASIILFESLGQELGRYLMVLSQPVASNVLQFIRGAAWMPIPIVFLLVGSRDHATNTVLASWMTGSAAACMFGAWKVRVYFKSIIRYRRTWLVDAFMSARHYFVVALLTQVQYYSDRFIVQRELGEGVVGVYSFYQSFSNTMVAFVQTGVISVLMPQLLLAARRNDVTAERNIRRSIMIWAMVLAIGISIALAVGMPVLLQELNKGGYDGALPVFYVLLVGNIILVASLVVHLFLYARRRDAALMRISLILVPLGLAINILAVPAYGIMGAAWTFIAIATLDLLLKTRLLWHGRHVGGAQCGGTKT